jgi:phosphatidylglycerophosphate synthase
MVYRHLKFIKKNYIDASLAPLLKKLYILGLRPNHITFFSIPCGVLGVILFFEGNPLSGFLIPFYIFLDVLDGSLARVTGSVTRFGDILDSAGDRIVASLYLILNWVHGGSVIFSATGLFFIVAMSLEDFGLLKRKSK